MQSEDIEEHRISSIDSMESRQPEIDDIPMASYQKLINEIEDDIAEFTIGKEEHLVSCPLHQNRTINVIRNITEGFVKVAFDLPSIEQTHQTHPKPDQQTAHFPQQQLDNQRIIEILGEKEIIIENYKELLIKSNGELSNYRSENQILSRKVAQLQAELSISTASKPQIEEIEYQKYEHAINQLEDQISILSKDQDISTLNTLKIVEGEKATLLQLEEVETVQRSKGISKYYTSRQIAFNLEEKLPKQNTELEQLRTKYNQLEQHNSNEHAFLKSQIFVLLEQLQNAKLDNERANNLLIEYEIKLSNNRDFYKVKLVDLQRMVKEKSKYLSDLDDQVEYVQHELREKMNNHQNIQSLVSSYTTTIQHINNQLEQEQFKTGQLRRILQQKNEAHVSDVQRYNKSIQDLSRQFQNQSVYANDVYNELKEQKNVNNDLKNVVEKLWVEIKDLNEQFKEKERENEELKELKESKEVEQEIEDMKRIIEDLSDQVNLLKDELFSKTSELQEVKERLLDKEEEAKQYESQIKLQLYALQRLRESTDKADDYILELKSQLSDVSCKLQEQQTRNMSDIHAHFQNIKGSNLVEELKSMKLGDKNVSFEMVLKLIEIIEEYSLDIDNLENQNNQLRNLIIEYEEIIEQQLMQIKNIQSISKEIDEPENRLGKKTLNYIRNGDKTNKQFYNTYSTPSRQELEIYQELANDLEEERRNNITLNLKLKETHKELMEYERQIFEKTQAINYLNLALIKASTSIEQPDDKEESLRSQNKHLERQVEQLHFANQNLEDNMKRVINGKNKQIDTLKYQISILDNSVIPELKAENDQCIRAIDKLEIQNKRLLKELERLVKPTKPYEDNKILNETKIHKNNLTLEQFKAKKFTYPTILYLMLRLVETLQTTGHMKSFHPEDIYILGYNESDPSALKIKLAFCGGEHDNGVFTAPEVIKGEAQSAQSIAWNYGLIFDYLFFRQPYYSTEIDILSKKSYEIKGKIPFLIDKLLRGLIVKQKRKRLSLQECRSILEIEIQKQ